MKTFFIFFRKDEVPGEIGLVYLSYTKTIMIMETALENRSVEIANTIRQQLMGLGKIKVWSWGANNWKAITNGLSFRVQGFKFRGIVSIILMGNDTYTIRLIKRNKLVEEFTNVYFDEMVDLIDYQVEYTGENYEKDVNSTLYKF